MITAAQLADKTKNELMEVATELEIEILNPAKLKKDEIVELIVQGQIARSGIEVASGILDVLPEGYGFLRRAGYYIGNDDIYVSQTQIRRFELRRGDMVEGQARRPKESEKYYGLIRVDKVNDLDPEAIKGRRVPLKKERRSIRKSASSSKSAPPSSRRALSISSARSAWDSVR